MDWQFESVKINRDLQTSYSSAWMEACECVCVLRTISTFNSSVPLYPACQSDDSPSVWHSSKHVWPRDVCLKRVSSWLLWKKIVCVSTTNNSRKNSIVIVLILIFNSPLLNWTFGNSHNYLFFRFNIREGQYDDILFYMTTVKGKFGYLKW